MSVSLLQKPPHQAASASKHPGGAAPYVLPTGRADRRWHRVLSAGLLLALAVHAVVLLSFRTMRVPPSPFAAAGPDARDYRAAAGGGGGMEAVEFRVQRPQASQAEPTPIPVIEAPEIVEPEIERSPVPDPGPDLTLSLPDPGTTGEGAGEGTDVGPGTATGTGQGGGGSAEEGRSGIVAPVPRGMILPPADRPRSVRGREVTVWVFVTDQGRVLPDSTRLEPPTADRGYNRRLMRSAAEWSFEPARKAGRPIPAWYPYQIIL